MSDLIFPGWRNSNQNINYPFVDAATLTNSDNVTIDRDLFDDARIYPLGGGIGAFLSRVDYNGTTLTFFISDPVNDDTAFGTLANGAASDEIQLVDSFGRPAGILVSDSTRLQGLFSRFPQGDTIFTATETSFVASVVVPMPQYGVQGVILDDGTFIAGDLYLCGTAGIVLTVDGGLIRIDIVGDPYALLIQCTENGNPLPSFCGLRTINNIAPDANGDYKLTQGANQAVDNIMRVVPTTNGITLVALGNRTFNGRA